MSTLITGATGAVGQAFVHVLRKRGERVRVLIRNPDKASQFSSEEVIVGDLFDREALKKALEGMERVVHIPPRVYPMGTEEEQLSAHRRVHLESTRLLVEEWQSFAPRRLLYISSAHAGGRSSKEAVCEWENRPPVSPYAQAKREAEEMLMAHARKRELDPYILRPPGIYGPGCKSLVTSLLKAARRGLPLPVRNVRSQHSLIFVDNLAEIGRAVLEHKNGPIPRILNVKDRNDYLPEDLYGSCCQVVRGKKPATFSIPSPFRKGFPLLAKNIPGLRRLGVLASLFRSEMYCNHLFRKFFPNFAWIELEEGLRRTV